MAKRRRLDLSGGLVYSSEHGRMCPGCSRPVAACVCREPRDEVPSGGDGVVRVRRETKGRKGKGVTVVDGLPLRPSELAALAKRLKRVCGAGGTVRDGVIELQGDHRDVLVRELSSQGYRVKRAGA